MLRRHAVPVTQLLSRFSVTPLCHAFLSRLSVTLFCHAFLSRFSVTSFCHAFLCHASRKIAIGGARRARRVPSNPAASTPEMPPANPTSQTAGSMA